MGFQHDFDWSHPPSKKFKKVKVPQLVTSSYSSSREMDEAEDLNDTVVGPTSMDDPNNTGTPPSTSWWYSSRALVLIFIHFGHSMTKGEKFELVFKQVSYMGVFLLSYNSHSSEVFVDRVVNLSPMVLWLFWTVFLHAYSSTALMHACWIRQSPYFLMHFKFFISYIKCVYELQDIGGSSPWYYSTMCIFYPKNIPQICTSSGGVLLYLAIKFLNISIYTSYVYPRWKLNLYCHQSPKRGRL